MTGTIVCAPCSFGQHARHLSGHQHPQGRGKHSWHSCVHSTSLRLELRAKAQTASVSTRSLCRPGSGPAAQGSVRLQGSQRGSRSGRRRRQGMQVANGRKRQHRWRSSSGMLRVRLLSFASGGVGDRSALPGRASTPVYGWPFRELELTNVASTAN